MANTFKFGNGQWAVGKETALAYNDENNNFKPLPFSFDRGSTATRVNRDGLIETVGADEPRIDFLNNPKGHLLLEPQRTNSFLQSNNFNTSWSVSNATLTGGQSGVGGGNDAWLFTASSGTNEKKIFQSSPLSGNVAVSVYAKKGTNDYLWLRGVTSGFAIRTWFNLSTGQVATDNAVSSEMVDMGNGWYRCIAIFNQDAGWDFHIGNSNQDNQVSVNTTGTIYIQYAQSETGSYATSYIPTSGSAVTRSADGDLIQSVENVISNSDTYSFLGDFYLPKGTQGGGGEILFENTSGSSQSRIYLNLGSFIRFRTDYPATNYDITYSTLGLEGGDLVKIGLSVNNGVMKVFVNGVLRNTFGAATIDFKRIHMRDITEVLLKKYFLYNTALSDSELQALTSG